MNGSKASHRRTWEPGDEVLDLSELPRDVNLLDHDEARLARAREVALLYVEPLRDLGLGRQQPLNITNIFEIHTKYF